VPGPLTVAGRDHSAALADAAATNADATTREQRDPA
jgi:hypothetical protein